MSFSPRSRPTSLHRLAALRSSACTERRRVTLRLWRRSWKRLPRGDFWGRHATRIQRTPRHTVSHHSSRCFVSQAQAVSIQRGSQILWVQPRRSRRHPVCRVRHARLPEASPSRCIQSPRRVGDLRAPSLPGCKLSSRKLRSPHAAELNTLTFSKAEIFLLRRELDLIFPSFSSQI